MKEKDYEVLGIIFLLFWFVCRRMNVKYWFRIASASIVTFILTVANYQDELPAIFKWFYYFLIGLIFVVAPLAVYAIMVWPSWVLWWFYPKRKASAGTAGDHLKVE